MKKNRVNYFALTPATSFDLRSSMGRMDERVLLYHLVQRIWPNPRAGPKNVFQGYVKKKGRFRQALRGFRRFCRIDPDLASALERRIREEGEGFRRQYESLCERSRRFRKRVPGKDRRKQARFIARLRWLLAEVCVAALEPQLVILDEFQRFKDLLSGEGEVAGLAKRLFTYSDATSAVRLLLLSATPYRMYTLHHESARDDHYRDFLQTVEFLDPALGDSGELRSLLDDYRRAMYRIDSGVEELRRIKGKVETRLRRVMSRTERLRDSGERCGMMREVPCPELELKKEDVVDLLALEKIGREVGQSQVLDYWMSAPYPLSFMDDYKLKTAVRARLEGSDASARKKLVELLTGGDCKTRKGPSRLALPWEDVKAYGRIASANWRLRSLLAWMERSKAWSLLWLPPSLPYYSEADSWRIAREQELTKRLIFSTWQVVPRAVASIVSYDVERRIVRRFAGRVRRPIRNTRKGRRKRRPLLRFAFSKDRPVGMPVLGILYPSPSLVELGDPVPRPEGEATLTAAVARARERLEPVLGRLTSPYGAAEREDQRWYWAAPILLDLERYGESTRAWFARENLPRLWNGAREDEDTGSRWADHVAEAKKLVVAEGDAVRGSLNYGRPPEDLGVALATRAVAGPATTALRGLTRASVGPNRPKPKEAWAMLAARDGAARIAWGFRTLFNVPEALALVQGGRKPGDETPYWRQVVDYCAAGNLQAVMDEYIHTLRDLEGLFAVDTEEAWEKIAEAVTAALSLRTGVPRVDELRCSGDTVRLKDRRLRNHFAMRFGTQESVDGRTGARQGQVRQAFNSPFWPFVLASTSVGQEGLDFHAWCHSVVHWNLPSNPVDLEQREGRVHRYKGHAVRKNVARVHGPAVLGRVGDVWSDLFEAARKQSGNDGGLEPYWLFHLEGGAYIERHVPVLPLSRDASRLEALKRSLAVYRMVFGQPRQDDLMAFLLEPCRAETLREAAPSLSIDLTPRREAGRKP